MKKLEVLTKEQEQLMYQTRDEWINKFFNLKRINEKKFEKGIKWLYEDLLRKKNPKIIYCESWLEALLTIESFRKNNVGDNVGANVWDNVWDNVRANVMDNVMDNVGANVRANVRANVMDNVGANVWDNVGANVRANVMDNVREYSDYISTASNFGWVSFYDYFEKIGILENKNFQKYKELLNSGVYQCYEYENYVFAIQPPKNIFRNEQGQLNSTEVKAFEWLDGYGFYFINGQTIPEEYFLKIRGKKLTVEEYFKIENEEHKSAIIGMIEQLEGSEGVYQFFKDSLKEVDTYVDKKDKKYMEGTTQGMNVGVYTLFKGKINKVNVAYVRCYCPSTDRLFFLGADPSNTNAKDAIASLYRVPKILKNNIVSILRQGEMYSTIFDKSSTEKLKNNKFSLEELNNLVSLSGEEYFSKIKYEY